MTIFVHGKQKRVLRPQLIDGLPVDELIARNADPIWLHENEMWELMTPDNEGWQRRPRAVLPMNKTDDLKVFISNRDSTCDECHEELGRQAWILLAGERGALCLACADLEHLAFLPSGNAALTRRAKKHSRLRAVVLKWSRARKHYERQGLLIEEKALASAEAECLADKEVRQRRQEREALRRAELDDEFVSRFAQRIRELFPGCGDRERTIAEFACLKYSGRIGRSAAAKHLEPDAVRLAVIAHVRHVETDYDALLGSGMDRHDARRCVRSQIEQVLDDWQAHHTDTTA